MLDIKDCLFDIVQHTHGLGDIELAKVAGTDKETTIESISNDRSVIIQGKFKKAVKKFEGTFGLPNLAKLNTILNIPEYKDNAKIEVTEDERNGIKNLTGLHFENKAGDFNNDYRFMTTALVNEKLKSVKFKDVKWGVDFVPTMLNIQRLKFQASAHSDETTFVAKTDGKNLKFYFGDHSTHAGEFVFQSDIKGTLAKSWSWPVTAIINILSLPGDKTMKFSDEGAAMITVDSGLVNYNYILPAQTK